MQSPPTATPSCAQPGGRYSMSPASSSHSCSGSKRAQHLQRHVVAQRRVARAADAPAPPALHLQQEHVVRIDVRPDAAAVAGVRHHQVVEPRVGHEAKARQQLVRRLRRAGRRPAPAASSRAASAAAARAAAAARGAASSARPRCTTRRDSTSSRAASANSSRGDSSGATLAQRLAHQQRPLLPVPAHELRRASGRRARRAARRRRSGHDGDCAIMFRWTSRRPASSA